MGALVDVRALSKAYAGRQGTVEVLRSLDLRVDAGEFAALMGVSGSGKSTLLQILGCLDRPSAGSYHLNGRAVAELADRELSALRNAAIGFVFQTSFFVDYFDLADNVALPASYASEALEADQARARALRLLDRVGLAHRARHLPAELSGGERQRASLARALFLDPWVILADEPTGNLDADNADRLAGLFQELNAEGRTVVLVTHDERIARRACTRYRLEHGGLVRA